MKRKISVTLILMLLIVWVASSCISTMPELAISIGSSRFWFGSYNGEPVQWRAVGTSSDGSNAFRLFLSNHVLANVQFNPEGAGNAWQGSAAQSWCGDFYANAFSAAEKAAIVPTTKTDAIYTGPDGSQFGESSLSNEYVFFLSAEKRT